jgi:hypothetical protein
MYATTEMCTFVTFCIMPPYAHSYVCCFLFPTRAIQAEYGTSDSTINQVVLWDAIIQQKVIRLQEVRVCWRRLKIYDIVGQVYTPSVDGVVGWCRWSVGMVSMEWWDGVDGAWEKT